MKLNKKNSGFTLIEVLVYLALFSIIIGGTVVSAYAVFEAGQNQQNKILLQEEGNYLLAKINWTLTGVKTIKSVSLSSLSVTKYDASLPNPLTLTWDGSTTLVTNGSGSNLPLNSQVKITNLQFTKLTTPSEGVNVQFTLSSTAENGRVFTQNFETTKFKNIK